jgi:hypothetical protein
LVKLLNTVIKYDVVVSHFILCLQSIAKFTDNYRNLKTREVHRPAAISSYFIGSNAVDCHNKTRQGDLRYEKHWITEDGWFRILTTIIFGITTTDAWLITRYGMGSTKHKCCKMTATDYAGNIAKDLLSMPWSDQIQGTTNVPGMTVNVTNLTDDRFSPLYSDMTGDSSNGGVFAFENLSIQSASQKSHASISIMTDGFLGVIPEGAPVVPTEFRMRHPTAMLPQGKKRTLRRECQDSLCRSVCKERRSQFKCTACNRVYCSDMNKRTMGRGCFYAHICEEYLKTLNSIALTKQGGKFKAQLNKWQGIRKETMAPVHQTVSSESDNEYQDDSSRSSS